MSRSQWGMLALVALLSLALQVDAARRVKLLPDYDEAIYWDVARNCHDTGRFARSTVGKPLFFDHPPLFFYFTAPVFRFWRGMEAIRFVVGLWSVAAIGLTGWLAARHAGGWAGPLAAALLGFNPLWVFYSGAVYLDVPFTVPTLAGLALLLGGWPLLAGVAMGLACLIKYFAAGFAGMAAIWLAVREPGGWRAAARFSVAFAGVAAVWPLAALAVAPADFLSKFGYWGDYLASPGHVVKHHIVMTTGEYLGSIVDRLTWPHAIVLVAGLLAAAREFRGASAGRRLVTMTAWGYTLTLLFFFALRSDRYVVPVLPLLCILAAASLEKLPARGRVAVAAMPIVLGLFVWMPGSGRPPVMAAVQYGPRVAAFAAQTEAAATWVRSQAPDSGRVAASSRIAVNWNGPRWNYMTDRSYSVLYTLDSLERLQRDVELAEIVVRDWERGVWHLPHLGPKAIAAFESWLAARFEHLDFGPVRVYKRRARTAS